jgi:hypothetical protein
VLFVQREKKRKPKLEEEGLQLIEASLELHEKVLHVEPGTLCITCRQGITRPVDRHICSVCEKQMHKKKCLEVHLEDCVDYKVSFSRKKR